MINAPRLFQGLNCTINTTEDCNLRCKYCYEINKKSREISRDSCYKFIDILLGDSSNWTDRMKDALSEGIVLDFIGGDSLMNFRLLDDVMEYFIYKLNILNHPCKNKFRFSICSNGTLFSDEVKIFLEKWKSCLSLGVSLDGCPEIHDMNRVFPNGEGSLNKILKDFPWYRENFPMDSKITKSTLSKNSIPYMEKSLRYLHEQLGIKYVFQNFVMEDCGLTDEDLLLFDSEMEKCVSYVKEHSDDLYWSMIDKKFLLRRDLNNPIPNEPMCGSGCMPTLSIDGIIYPCFRWLPHTRKTELPFNCGNIETGIKMDGFSIVSDGSLRSKCTRDLKCKDCIYEPCCSYCIGGCYAEYGDFRRTTYICEIIKNQCKWAEEYWNGKKN